MTSKIGFCFTAIGLLFLTVSVMGDASAQIGGSRVGSGNSGYCPAGTCARDGGKYAKNLKFCSAANCRGAAR